MSSQSAVSVCNLALLSVGGRTQISSINPSDGSPAADACATLFQFVFEQYARTAKWGCLKKQITLTMVGAAQGTPENLTGKSLPIPAVPWSYAYLYPPDCLMMRQIVPPANSTAPTTEPQTTIANSVTPWIPGQYSIPYEIGYSTDSNGNPIQVILTNQQNAIGNYTVNQPDPASWDALFTSGYVAALAVYLAPALTLNMALMAQCKQQAEAVISIARTADGNENPVSQDHVPDWILARQGATGTLFFQPKYNAYGFFSMVWPGVV